MQTLRPFVCGTDFSEGAEQALQFALKLAIAARTRIALVHVCELDVDIADELRLLRCHEALNALVEQNRHRGVDVTGVLRSGTPWKKLDNVATDLGASLIVIGRWGVGTRNAALGSVANQLLRTASHPVLTVTNGFNHLDVEVSETKCK
jgi:nucleotide-binding universal stress UspA family protein